MCIVLQTKKYVTIVGEWVKIKKKNAGRNLGMVPIVTT